MWQADNHFLFDAQQLRSVVTLNFIRVSLIVSCSIKLKSANDIQCYREVRENLLVQTLKRNLL